MKFYGIVKEFPGNKEFAKLFDGKLLFKEGDRIRAVDSLRNEILLEQKGLYNYTFGMGGIWTSHITDDYDGDIINKYWDIWKTGKCFSEETIEVAGGIFDGARCIFQDIDPLDDSGEILFVKDMNSGDTVSRNFPCYSKFSTDGDNIFVELTKERILYCFDFRLNIRWEAVFPRRYTGWISSPLIFQDIVIINQGADHSTKRGEIRAYSKTDGSVVWTRTFDSEVSSHLAGDSLCIIHKDRMIVLDAATGRCLADEPSGIERISHRDILYLHDRRLFMIGFEDSVLRVFSEDGKVLIQELEIPGQYRLHDEVPLFCDGRYYLPLGTGKGVCSGLLVLEPAEEGQEPGVRCEERPATRTLTLEAGGGSQEYHVVVTDKNFDNVIRYGEIALKECGSLGGDFRLENPDRNTRFNGRIFFSANTDDFGEGAEEKIREMAASAEHDLSLYGFRAGNLKDPIRISVVPMSELAEYEARAVKDSRTEDSETDRLTEQVKNTAFGKMPLAVIFFASLSAEGDYDKRMKRAFTYISHAIKTGSTVSQHLFSMTVEIIGNDDILSYFSSKTPSTEELAGIIAAGAQHFLDGIEAGLFRKEDVRDFYDHLYNLGYEVMLPESENPEKNRHAGLILKTLDALRRSSETDFSER